MSVPPLIGRWLAEVFGAPSAAPPVSLEDAIANAPRGVRVEPGVYARTAPAAARVRLLEEAARRGTPVELHAPITVEGTHLGRLAIDAPRRVLRRLGVAAPEPGDRRPGGELVHAFFDDEGIALEARAAGLAFVARRGAWVTLEPSPSGIAAEAADPFAAELARVLRAVVAIERRRRADPPERAIGAARTRGRAEARARGAVGRARLRRAIGWVDAPFPGGPNCFRRTLLELALDRGAAEETLVLGLDVGRTGHVAFKNAEERAFDVVFEIPP